MGATDGRRLSTHLPGVLRANGQGLCGSRIGGVRIGLRDFVMSPLRTSSIPPVATRFGICANNAADRAPWELRGPISRP
eukprot:15468190-Alexandrium_andersonii.AAC.1